MSVLEAAPTLAMYGPASKTLEVSFEHVFNGILPYRIFAPKHRQPHGCRSLCRPCPHAAIKTKTDANALALRMDDASLGDIARHGEVATIFYLMLLEARPA